MDQTSPIPTDFYRIKRLPPYVFAEVEAMKAAEKEKGHDIVDLGLGNPDQPPPPHVIQKLIETAQDPHAHRYSMSRGIPGLRKAISGYYERRFGVSIDPEKEAIVTLGSKEGLANLAQAITTPGDAIIVPNPSYPIHAFGFTIAGTSLRFLPAKPGKAFMEGLERAVKHSVPKPVAVIISYPSNPTAHVTDIGFYEEVVDFCRFHKMWVISDLAYSELYFDDTPPPSVLQVKGAKDITIEFTSLSKTYNMPGWRVGFAAGNPHLIGALTRVKSYLDYGAFTPVQVAATAALNGPQDCVVDMRNLYRRRRDVLVDSFRDAGWDVPSPPATMFVWAPIPEPFNSLGSFAFARLLLENTQLAVSPGLGFGEYGDGHVRMSLVEDESRLLASASKLKDFLSKAGSFMEQAERSAA